MNKKDNFVSNRGFYNQPTGVSGGSSGGYYYNSNQTEKKLQKGNKPQKKAGLQSNELYRIKNNNLRVKISLISGDEIEGYILDYDVYTILVTDKKPVNLRVKSKYRGYNRKWEETKDEKEQYVKDNEINENVNTSNTNADNTSNTNTDNANIDVNTNTKENISGTSSSDTSYGKRVVIYKNNIIYIDILDR